MTQYRMQGELSSLYYLSGEDYAKNHWFNTAVILSLLSSYAIFTYGHSECYLVIWTVMLSQRTEGSNTLLMEKGHCRYKTKTSIIHISGHVASFPISNQSLNLSFVFCWQTMLTSGNESELLQEVHVILIKLQPLKSTPLFLHH